MVLTVLAAPLLWTAHLLASYLAVTLGCGTGWAGTRPVLLVLTLGLGGAAILPGYRTYRSWRSARSVERWTGAAEQATPVPRFLLGLGLLMTGVFALAILLGGLGLLLVPLCAMGSHH